MQGESRSSGCWGENLRRVAAHAMLWTACMVLVACSDAAEEQRESRQRGIERAREAAAELGRALMGELAEALAEKGPEDAVVVCSEVAQAIAARVSASQGLTVSRTALRVRNPANAPDDWERSVMTAWVEDPQSKGTSFEVRIEAAGRTLRLLQPIYTADLCLTCHGEPTQFSPALRQTLAERYPDDQAIGFQSGDLRGAFTVKVPLP